jgi:hypothetical protein
LTEIRRIFYCDADHEPISSTVSGECPSCGEKMRDIGYFEYMS